MTQLKVTWFSTKDVFNNTTELIDTFCFKVFKEFIDQEIEKYEDSLVDADEEPKKKSVEVDKPAIVQIDEEYYFISGPEEVFKLNTNPGILGYAKKLSVLEIDLLGKAIIYTGDVVEFSVNHAEAFTHLGSLIHDMNEMQDPMFYSFPLASFLDHLMGYMYTQIMDVQNGYITCITISGSGNTSRTGKSLLTSMWQLVFDGFKTTERPITITETAAFQRLSDGLPLYSKFHI